MASVGHTSSPSDALSDPDVGVECQDTYASQSCYYAYVYYRLCCVAKHRQLCICRGSYKPQHVIYKYYLYHSFI